MEDFELDLEFCVGYLILNGFQIVDLEDRIFEKIVIGDWYRIRVEFFEVSKRGIGICVYRGASISPVFEGFCTSRSGFIMEVNNEK